jgi:hypothetical protein
MESLPEFAIYGITLGRVLDAQAARNVAEGLCVEPAALKSHLPMNTRGR